MTEDPRIAALPDIHGHAKGEHKPFAEERPIPYTARMLFLWFFHACRRGSPRFLMVADHMNYLTFEDPAAVNLVRRALKLAQAGDLYGAAETAGVEIGHAAVVSEGLRKGMRYSIGAEIDNDPRCRPDAQNIVDAMKPDGTVRSVHFIPITHPQHGENWMWAFDNPEFKDLYDVVGTDAVWEIYMATLLDAIDKLPGNIIGHFYVPAKFGHWPDDAILEGYEDRFVEACAERGMAIEINSRYLYKYFVDDETNREKLHVAHLRLLRKAKEKNVAIAVGSDAHSPKDQGGAFDAVLALLDEADVNEIAFPIGGRLARVALRATEEILRQHTAALAPPPPVVRDVPVDDDADDEDDDNESKIPPPAPVETSAAEPVPAAPPKRKRPAVKATESTEAPLAVNADTAVDEAMPDVVEAEPAPVAAPVKKARPKKAPVVAASALAHDSVEAAPAIADIDVVENVAADVVEPPPLTKPAPAPKRAAATKPTVAKPAAKPVVKAVAAKKPAALKPAPAKPAAAKAVPVKAASKKATPVKAAAKKAASKKPIATKAAPKKAASAKKAAPTKSVAKKPTSKAAVKKAPAAKAASKKAAPKKAVAKKVAATKAAPKKTIAKKIVAKKAGSKKAAAVRKPVAKKAAKKIAKRSRR